MKMTNRCYSAETLTSYLRGGASPQEESATKQHLNSCSICREQLENVAGDGEWWNDAKALLADMNDGDLQCDVKLSDTRRG